jgi:polyhydroxybutyrate depolymerase
MKAKSLSASMIVFFIAFLLATSMLSSGQSSARSLVGGETSNKTLSYNATMVWDGLTRYYYVHVPTGLPSNPPLLVMLHATSLNPANEPPISNSYEWLPLSNQYKFILVVPASTYNSQSGQWNWNAYYLNEAFTPAEVGTCTVPPATACPDDAGFLRNLIVTLTEQYNIDPNQVFVAGMSSGAMMAERVGVEISDLVAAIIPASGQIVGQSSLPITLPGPPVAPVSVQEWQGTNDHVLPPCNNGTTLYSGYTFYMATVDQTFNYWTAQNACTVFQNNEPLCEKGKANPSTTGNDATGCTNNVEVQFIWEEKLGHGWDPANNEARWQFFASHPKQ